MFLLISEKSPFLALPRKQVPRAQAIFVAQAGRKFRLFFFDNAKVQKFQSTSKLFFKKSTQKSTQ